MHNIFSYFANKLGGLNQFVYVDVGAMGGIPMKWHCMHNLLTTIAFEHDTREYNKLQNSKTEKFLNYALHNKSMDLNYYITKEAGKSSLLKPNMALLQTYENSERYTIAQEETIPQDRVKTLDSLLQEGAISDMDFIKLDTQGSELYILEGGKEKAIPALFGAQIEVEFMELYKNQLLFRDVDQFMSDHGFNLIDLRRAYWKRKEYHHYIGKGELIFGDALYFKKINLFLDELSNYRDKTILKHKLLKSLLSCIVFRVFDYAIAIVEASTERGYLSHDEKIEISNIIKKFSISGLPLKLHLPIKVYGKLLSLFGKFRPLSYLGWADGDKEIGNTLDV